MPSSRVTDPPPAAPAPGATDRPDMPGVEDDPIGELLRHHHERTPAQSHAPALPRGSADLAPARPRARRPSRPQGTSTRALGERLSRLAPRSQTATPQGPARAPGRASYRATLRSLATQRRLWRLLVAVAALAGLTVVILRPPAQTRSSSPSARDSGQLGNFSSLRTTLTRIDQGAVLVARSAITQEQRAIAARRARAARRRVARRRAAERRARAQQHHTKQTTARTTAGAGTSTPTTAAPSVAGQSAPTTPTTTATQASTQTTPVAPTQTTPSSGSSTSSPSSGSTHAPAYGSGGVLGAGHSSDSS